MTTRDARIKQLLSNDRFALIGAGQLAAMSFAMWPSGVAKPEFILDSAKSGTLDGVEILDLKTHQPVAGMTYLISVFKLPAKTVKEIFIALGQHEILTVYDFFEETMPAVFSNGWRNLEPSADTVQSISHIGDDYADDLSRTICDAVTAWRYRRELVDFYPVGPEEAKYDLGLLGHRGHHYDIVYDCGSYDLGVISSLKKADVTFDRLIAFEADPARIGACKTIAGTLGESIEIVAKAVTDRNGKANFIASGLLSARLTDAALDRADLIEVETTTLDSFHEAHFGWDHVPERRILLKLHIEGAELSALWGARRLLGESCVDIMLNLSHDEVSYLEIAPFIASFSRHDIYLRSHSLFGEGLTLTALCRNTN